MTTYARCVGIFVSSFTANLLENQPVKEFWQLVKNWQRYHHEYDVILFIEHSVVCRVWLWKILGYYSTPDGGAEYCDDVCLFVCVCCLSVCNYIFGTACPIFTKFFVHVTCGCGLVSSGGVVIPYLLVLWMTSYLHISYNIAASSRAALGLAINST